MASGPQSILAHASPWWETYPLAHITFFRTPDGMGCMVMKKVMCARGYVSHHGEACAKIDCGPDAMLDHLGKNCISRDAYEFYAIYHFHMRCNSRQKMIYSDEGGCEYCPEYHRAFSNDPWVCQQHTCGIRQILLPNGLCETCAPYQEARKFYCIQQVCKHNEKLRTDGVCERCPARYVHSADKHECIEAAEHHPCDRSANQFMAFDGKCHQCPVYTTVDEIGHNCIMPYCQMDEIFTRRGTCRICPAYTRPAHDGFYCRADNCLADEVLQMDGTCRSMGCPHGYYRKHIVDDHCDPCPRFHRPNHLANECINDICMPNQRVTINGHCQYCGPYMIAKHNKDKDIYECHNLYCEAETDIPTWSGNCFTCPEGYTPAFKEDPYENDADGNPMPVMITNPNDPDGPKVKEKDYWCTEIAEPEPVTPEPQPDDDGGQWVEEVVVVRKRRYVPNDGPAGPTVVTQNTSGTTVNANVAAADAAAYEGQTGVDTSAAGGRRLLEDEKIDMIHG
jgi:hypothetical protein